MRKVDEYLTVSHAAARTRTHTASQGRDFSGPPRPPAGGRNVLPRSLCVTATPRFVDVGLVPSTETQSWVAKVYLQAIATLAVIIGVRCC